jgi:tetratricopeptide (TPR) repeat protein
MWCGNATKGRLGVVTLLATALLGILPAAAQECAAPVGRLESLDGEVSIQDQGVGTWRPAELGEQLCQVVLVNDEVLRLDQETMLNLKDVPLDTAQPTLLDLAFGAVQSFSRSPKKVNVNTSYMTLAIRGTEFVIRAEQEQSLLTVFEGEVLASNAQGELPVPSGQSAVARPGQAPQPYLVARPRDAVQWSLYYPPIFSAPPGDTPKLAALDRVPGGGAGVQTYRAALLLQVGRVDEARTALDAALAADPQAGQADALRSIISVVQNQRDEALADAQKAVELDPKSAAAKIALSYAQQAQFNITGARQTMQQATEEQPNDALAWARLSELWLMEGYRDRSREAADRAAALAPDLNRVQTVRGFADLVEFRTFPAKLAFDHAIALNSADPLPRFGLGLAEIREGALEDGRKNIELAVGLDSSNALLRTYLGKAYFEERREKLSGEQYQLAKELDPLDPTAYLYDAIRLQTINRPVEALDQLDKSIELNDNRAVYRSRLLLDSDRAARGASLARVYQDLDYLAVGQRQATNSLTLDPSNAAAHRFLSDIFAGARRVEVSRVSELLQSQLLQELNVDPVQPGFAETNLNIVTQGGPTTPGYNEFTPLFERNRLHVTGTGTIGDNDTKGGEFTTSALYNQYSISAGAFTYDTDGWRQNADNRQTIYDVYFQSAVTPDLNTQIEFRRRDSHHGDLQQLWDPDTFAQNADVDQTQDTFRLGGRYRINPNSDLLTSFIYTHNDENDTDNSFDPDIGLLHFNTPVNQDAYQGEIQHIYRQDKYNIITGGLVDYVNNNVDFKVVQDGVNLFKDENIIDNSTQYHPYVYGNFVWPTPLTWTVGLSYDHYEQGDIEWDKVNPKLGVQWAVTNDLTLRAAAFQVVKPGLLTNRTIEPTQVAGFNQFYDDTNGTPSRRAGVGFDWRLNPRLFVGGEASWRELDVSYVLADNSAQQTNWDEQTHSLYAYWAPLDMVAFRTGLVYDRFSAQNSQLTEQFTVPQRLTTWSVPVGVNFFHPSGVFAGITTTFVNQDLNRSSNNITGLGQGDSSFALVDFRVGYRLPQRYGLVTLAVNNLFDKSFDYQDNTFREFQNTPTTGPYIPDRQILLYVTLNW